MQFVYLFVFFFPCRISQYAHARYGSNYAFAAEKSKHPGEGGRNDLTADSNKVTNN